MSNENLKPTNPSYIITSGWWCSGIANHFDRTKRIGDESIRTQEFHHQWLAAIKRFTNPEKIFIVDSNSPVPCPVDPSSEVIVSLLDNAGHPSMHSGKLSGVSYAHILGMTLAYVNDADFWVYVEQDALIYGDGIIEKCIEKMRGDYMFGSGDGTPQPVQHSLMVMRKDAIPVFVKRFCAIDARDCEISPEIKFAIATSKVLSMLPTWVYKIDGKAGPSVDLRRRFLDVMFKIFRGFDEVPFGYGRARPIDFDSEFFYFQHGSFEEIDQFDKRFRSEDSPKARNLSCC